MRVHDARDCYYESTAKSSEIVRQLALAGIAVVWIFHADSSHTITLPGALLFSLSWFVVTLLLDLVHYLVKSAMWGLYHRRKEIQLKALGIINLENDPNAAFEAPRWMNWPPIFFFWAKVVALLTGAAYLGAYLHSAIGAAR